MDGIGEEHPVDHSPSHAAAMQHRALTETVIGCAYRVYNAMGFGFLESVYEKCLLIELGKAGIRAETQKPIKGWYEGELVGDFIADVLVDDCVIVELKSVRRIIKAAQDWIVAPSGLQANRNDCSLFVSSTFHRRMHVTVRKL